MQNVPSNELQAFQRRYRFVGGRIRRVRIRYLSPLNLTVELIVTVQVGGKKLNEPAERVHLRVRMDGVEEFRFQKRPNTPTGKITDARFGYLQGMFFVNWDAFGLEPGDVPKVFDYRASDAYLAGKTLSYEEIVKKK